MRTRAIGTAVATLLLFSSGPVWGKTYLIKGAHVFDGTGTPATLRTVLIRDGVIEAVSDGPLKAPGATVIDARGQTLLPGLFDVHTHLSASATRAPADLGKNLAGYTVLGVTDVNEFSAYGEMYKPLRDLKAKGVLPPGKLNLATRFSTEGGHGAERGWGDEFTLTVDAASEARAAVASALPYHPDLFKVFTDGWRYGSAADLSSMDLPTLSALTTSAHEAGIKVVTHTVTLAGAKLAARADVDMLAHGVGDALVDDELIALMKKSGTGYAPTLAVYEPRAARVLSERALKAMRPDEQADAASIKPSAVDADSPGGRRWAIMQENVRRLSKAGIPITVGTDAGVGGVYHGWSTLREMELLVQAGLTPAQALTAGTRTSAEILGQGEKRGQIAPGMIADLVLVDGRPDLDITDIERTRRVFVAGDDLDLKRLRDWKNATEATELPRQVVNAVIDDGSRADGRTLLDTLPVTHTDPGVDHSEISFTRLARQGGGRNLFVLSRMSPKDKPYVRLELPLTPGAVTLADASGYAGVTLKARGEGSFRLLAETYGGSSNALRAAPIALAGEMQVIRIPFEAFVEPKLDGALDRRSMLALLLELAGPAGEKPWLEVESIGFYR